MTAQGAWAITVRDTQPRRTALEHAVAAVPEYDQVDRLLLGGTHDLLARMSGDDAQVWFEPGTRGLTLQLAKLLAEGSRAVSSAACVSTSSANLGRTRHGDDVDLCPVALGEVQRHLVGFPEVTDPS